MRNEDGDELDRLIDGALREYSEASPLEGLENRILQRIHMAGAGRRMPLLNRWVIAAAAAATLVMAGFILRSAWKPTPDIAHRSINPTLPEVAAITPPLSTPGTERPVARRLTPKPRNRTGQERSARFRALPKREYFPTAEPLTPEERALAAWASRSPSEASEVFAGLRKRIDEPVTIQPIQIAPLQSDDVQ